MKHIFQQPVFRTIMYFKFFMVIFIWGLIPLLIPPSYLPLLGLYLNPIQIRLLRIWGVIVLLDTLIYRYIYIHPTTKLAGKLMLFATIDNGVLGLLLLILTPIFRLPWGIWANIPFQLFFGYWFWKFYRANKSQNNMLS